MSNAGMMKPPVEVEYREELEALASSDTAKKRSAGSCHRRPSGRLSGIVTGYRYKKC